MLMPRSNDGRWTRQCAVCGQDYQQRRPAQVVCSITCRRKLPNNSGGARVAAGLDPRICKGCEQPFQPTRKKQLWCSYDCYKTSDNLRQTRARTNFKRRIGTAPDPSSRRAENLRLNLMRYGLTVEEYEARLAAQGGVCIICGMPPKENGQRAASRLHVDHDHVTGANRDLICNNCNRGLGYFKDDPALMRAAAEYIERHRAAVPQKGSNDG